jgi:hypothetical protein
LWAEHRQVTKQALVSLFGNRYQVDPALVGATVELVFDPFDLAKIEVRYQQRPMGAAVPFQLGRHVHPAATAAPAQPAAGRPSGIDYLAMVAQRTTATQRRRIAYASLPPPELPAPIPDPAAGTHDRAATADPSTDPSTGASTGDTAQAVHADVGVHPATTITPHPADDHAADDPTTPPVTNIQPADTDPNQPPLIIIDATLEEEL